MASTLVRISKLGIDVEALERMKSEIGKFLDLDPRGGYFSQLDMYAAVRQIATMDAVRELFVGFYTTKGFETEDAGIHVVAYSYRCGMAHFREKAKQFKALEDEARSTSHPEWIKKLYEKIT